MRKLVICALIQVMLVLPLSASATTRHPVDGVWKSMRARPGLVDGTIRFDIINKTASFSWQGRGRLSYAIESVDVDKDFGMTRYSLSLRGQAGTMEITVLIAGETSIYIGQTPRGGIAIWGAYTRQN